MLSLYQIKEILNPDRYSKPGDDFRILDSWAVYDQNTNKTPAARPLEYLCYECETMNPQTGVRSHYYKAIKFARVIRLPANAKQSTAFMDMQEKILSAVHSSGINLITIIANIIRPNPIGLLYLYGTQGVSESLEEAKKKASYDFEAFVKSMQATFRVLEMRIVYAEESEWLREKMYNMPYMTAIRGIPFANKAGEDAGNKGVGNANLNPDSDGTLEKIITGLVEYEYVIEILSSPVYNKTLMGWQRDSQEKMTTWYGQLQGQKSLSMNLSIPMMYMASASQAQGWSKAFNDSNSVSYARGESFTASQGTSTGQSLSKSFGESRGQTSGTTITNSVSRGVSQTRGESFGRTFGESQGIGVSESNGISHSVSHGYSHGVSTGMTRGISSGISNSVNQGLSNNVNQGVSANVNRGLSNNINNSTSQNLSQGLSKSVNQSMSSNVNRGMSHSENRGVSASQSVNQSTSLSRGKSLSETYGHSDGSSYNITKGSSSGLSHSLGLNKSTGYSQNQSMSMSNSASVGRSNTNSVSQSLSENFGTNENHSAGWSRGGSSSHNDSLSIGVNNSTGESSGASDGTSTNGTVGGGAPAGVVHASVSTGKSHTLSANMNVSAGGSANYGESNGSTTSHSTSGSDSYGSSHSMGGSVSNSASVGNSFSQSASRGFSQGYGLTQSVGSSESYAENISNSLSRGFGVNQSNSHSLGSSESVNLGQSYGLGKSAGQTYSEGIGQSLSMGQGISRGTGLSNSMSLGQGVSQSIGQGLSFSAGSGQSLSLGSGASLSRGTGQNFSESASQSVGESFSENIGVSDSQSYTRSLSQNYSQSRSESYGQSQSVSESKTLGESLGQSLSNSVSESRSTGYGLNQGQSQSTSQGNSYTVSNGQSRGVSNGTSGTTSLGTSASMGFGPSIGYSKSYQWMDQAVKDLLELLEYQNERIKKGLRQGAFYTYVYIACPSLDALSAAQAVAKTAWQNEFALVQPLQVLDLTESEQKHLLYRFEAFSADITREDVFGASQYKYCTVLLPEEYVAYTHLPRVSEGGVFSIVQDVPKFSVPSMMKGEIYMGTILNAERYSFTNGYMTPYDYRVPEEAMMHGFFTGASRSGKTVAAMRFIAELAQVRRKKTGKRLRIVVMDPKQDWRMLARFVEPERFNFYSIGNPTFRPIKINPWKIPKGVWPQIWIDGIIDIYCRSYGLLERGKQMIAGVVFELYSEAGVFDACDDPDWKKKVRDLSSAVCFREIYKRMEAKRDEFTKMGKAGNDTKDAYARLLERLSCFSREYSIENRLYGTAEGIAIDELIGDDEVTVLESKGLENTFKNFIFGAITSGFYKFALAHDGGFLAPDQYETVLVIEEANEVLIGTDKASGNSDASLPGESEFEQIIDQSAGYGMFVIAITQKIADMPSSIIANSGLIFAGRLERPDDITAVVRAIGREERIDDRDTVKWFPRSPIGWFVCKTARNFDFKESEPCLVAIQRLQLEKMEDYELEALMLKKEELKRRSKTA